MSDAQKLVSLVIPCYQGERFLDEAIASCRSQTYRDVEMIVVDDQSPDRCSEIAEAHARQDPRVRLIRRAANGGVSRAFNTGFGAARGVYFTRLAQDDLFREDAVEIMVRHLEEYPEIGLVYCDEQIIDESGDVIGLRRAAAPDEALADGDRVGLCVMWRREVWETIGEFDPAYDAAEDYEYWLRVAARFRIDKSAAGAPFYFRKHAEMGSERNRARQEVAEKRARARYCTSRRDARRLLGEGYFTAGYAYRRQGAYAQAFRHLSAALWYAPAVARNYRCLAATALEALRLR